MNLTSLHQACGVEVFGYTSLIQFWVFFLGGGERGCVFFVWFSLISVWFVFQVPWSILIVIELSEKTCWRFSVSFFYWLLHILMFGYFIWFSELIFWSNLQIGLVYDSFCVSDCIYVINLLYCCSVDQIQASAVMGWLSKIFGGSSHSHRGQYHGRYGEDTVWDAPTTSAVICCFLSLKLVSFARFHIWLTPQ